MKHGIRMVFNVKWQRRLYGFNSLRLSHNYCQSHNFHFLLKIHFPL